MWLDDIYENNNDSEFKTYDTKNIKYRKTKG